MKKYLIRLPLILKAIRELGFVRSFWYAVYQLGLRSGFYRLAAPTAAYEAGEWKIHPPFNLPGGRPLKDTLGKQAGQVIQEADEIADGQVRLFGGPPVALNLAPRNAAHHWTYYEGRPAAWGVEDIKYLWEPARFGWAYLLGRAYALTGDEKYPAAFWQHFETYLEANPPNRGPNWSSAQEVALRLLAMLFSACAFQQSPSSTPERMARLAGAIAAHARRIPPTLSYARAQNNNHRVTEALGLYAAGRALPEHPQAKHWQSIGWRELNAALHSQILPDGTYAQHSMNYHRLMLHAALQAPLFGQAYPAETKRRLAAATTWLLAQIDPSTGRAPNLGSNDGANILPLGGVEFTDYRPAAQAAARAFLDRPAFPPGPWDELSLWLGQPLATEAPLSADASHPVAAPLRLEAPLPPLPQSPAVHRLGDSESWGTLRAVRFKGRPSHADQLHVDLWWRGENIAMDAGTYRYTAAAPWDNTLAETFVHNTIEINGQNQMQRAGRFLWLDWAQASLLSTRRMSADAIAAQHDGYLHLGVLHRRILKRTSQNAWQVIDHLLREHTIRMDVPRSPIYPVWLHWLLPDWPWKLDGSRLTLTHPSGGKVRLSIMPDLVSSPIARAERLSLVRAGQVLAGPAKAVPVLGWYSPTYGTKVPALSLSLTVRSPLPVTIFSDWTLED